MVGVREVGAAGQNEVEATNQVKVAPPQPQGAQQDGIFVFILGYASGFVPSGVKEKCRPMTNVVVLLTAAPKSPLGRVVRAITLIAIAAILYAFVPFVLKPIEMIPLFGSTLTFVPNTVYRISLITIGWMIITDLLPCHDDYPEIRTNLALMLPELITNWLPSPTPNEQAT